MYNHLYYLKALTCYRTCKNHKNWQVEFSPIYCAVYTEAMIENEAHYKTQDIIYKNYYQSMRAWQFTLQGETRTSHTYRFGGGVGEILVINKNPAFRKMNLSVTQKSFYMDCDSLKC